MSNQSSRPPRTIADHTSQQLGIRCLERLLQRLYCAVVHPLGFLRTSEQALRRNFWLNLTIGSFAQKRPGMVLPPGKKMWNVGFFNLWEATKNLWKLKQTLIYLIAYVALFAPCFLGAQLFPSLQCYPDRRCAEHGVDVYLPFRLCTTSIRVLKAPYI